MQTTEANTEMMHKYDSSLLGLLDLLTSVYKEVKESKLVQLT